MTVEYPQFKRDETVDLIHGKLVPDPYRWLENPESIETKNFITKQNELLRSILKSNSNIYDKFKEKLYKIMDYPRFGCPMKRGEAFYYFLNTGLQAQSVLYKQDNLNSEPRVFFDPNALSTDGTISLSTFSFSKSGKYFAYALSHSGSDWVDIHVRNTDDSLPQDIESTPIKWAKFTTISWTLDEKGFFYNKYPQPTSTENAGTETDANKNPKIYYHKLFTPQSDDIQVFCDENNPDFLFSATVSEDGEYLILTQTESCDPKNKFYVARISELLSCSCPQKAFQKVVEYFV
jgi:prolyl oligopeptidase